MNGNLTFGYDAFNRLISMSGSKGDTYGYDRYGNRWNKGTGPNLTFGADNRIGSASSFAYDAAGNVLWDGFFSYCYDAENRLLRAVSDSNGTANPCDTSKPAVGVYSYDPSGLRVKATISGSTYDYVYDLAGHQIAQWDATNGRTRGEVYVGSMHVATFTPTETYFLHTDQVGTLRALTTHDGTVASKCPSSPFGDGFNCNIPSKTLFTDYERDGETGLDHSWFRQYSSRSGRYHSPDPVLGTPEDPQSWNRYAYVQNNPLAYTDPLGRNLAPIWDSWGWGSGGFSFYCPFAADVCGGIGSMFGSTSWDGDQIGGGFGSAGAADIQAALNGYVAMVDKATYDIAVKAWEEAKAKEEARRQAEARTQMDACIAARTCNQIGSMEASKAHPEGYTFKVIDGVVVLRPDSFTVSSKTGAEHKDVGWPNTDFRSHNRTFGSGSLQIVVGRDGGLGYFDVDRFNPNDGFRSLMGHIFLEMIPHAIRGY